MNSSSLRAYQAEFIRFAIEVGVLKFGEFTLKSGRVSPYFFNTGLFDSGARLGRLGEFYAQTMLAEALAPDVIYGPAYKGITLACSTAIALAQATDQEVPFAFNRKEAKDHGEGGIIVGAKLKGEVLIIDDVITAGTSVRESISIIQAEGGAPSGVLIALDRQEPGQNQMTATQEIETNHKIPVHSIIKLEHILAFLKEAGRGNEVETITRYSASFNIT